MPAEPGAGRAQASWIRRREFLSWPTVLKLLIPPSKQEKSAFEQASRLSAWSLVQTLEVLPHLISELK